MRAGLGVRQGHCKCHHVIERIRPSHPFAVAGPRTSKSCFKTICVSRTCELSVFVVHWRRFFLNSTRHIERIRGVTFCDDALYKLTFTFCFGPRDTLQSSSVPGHFRRHSEWMNELVHNSTIHSVVHIRHGCIRGVRLVDDIRQSIKWCDNWGLGLCCSRWRLSGAVRIPRDVTIHTSRSLSLLYFGDTIVL